MTTSVEKVNGTAVASEPRFDPRALAEAEAIRTRAAADADARRIQAEGAAKAAVLAAEEEAAKQRIANERAELRLQRERAEQLAKIAEANRKREEADRLAAAAREAAVAQEQAVADQQAAEAGAAGRWRIAAIGFAIACGFVALPVQISAFWNPDAWWLASAPVFLEGGAWVVLAGAASAVAARRPHWHFRLIAWALAFVAAGVNLWHGLNEFDTATACATAFASLAGPGVWDLHEHGRIRKRDGVLSRSERKAAEKAAKAEAAERAAEEQRREAEKAKTATAAEEAAKQLAATRANKFPKVWEHAEKLAADLGETTVTEAIWKRAKLDVDGALPGESAEVFRMRNAAEARVEAARQKRSVNGSSPQVASQVPGAKKPRVYNPPARRGQRTKGDVKFAPGARRQASITARQTAAQKDAS